MTRISSRMTVVSAEKLKTADRMRWTLQNHHALDYVLTGEAKPQGWIWKLFTAKAKTER